MRPRRSQPQQAFALVGALVLAVLVCVAASLAIHSAQHRISEAQAKEGNIQARLALDSAASRILSQLDRMFEIKGAYGGADLQQWLQGQAPSVSGPYSVTFSLTNEVLPQDNTISIRAVGANGLGKNPMDPLYPDLWMDQTNFYIDITARATQPGYADYRARYNVQIRAIPVTEWAVFNPGQQRESVQLTRDSTDTDHHGVYAYVGTLYSGGFTASGCAATVTDASTADANQRLWRITGGGVAKYANSASQAALTFNGNYPDSEPDWSSYEVWGSLHDSTDTALNSSAEEQYDNFLQMLTGAPNWTTPSYQPVQISPNNPLYDPDPQLAGSYVAVLDLAGYLAERPALNCYTIQIPYSGASPIPTIVVTNAEVLAGAGMPLNVTFPPTVRVFFTGAVNTNLARLKVEGNIGFVPQDANVLAITNYTGNQRIPAPAIFATNEFRLVTRSDVTLDATNQVFVEHQRYAWLHQQLYQWASNIQARVLSDPMSPLYVPNAADQNYFLDYLALSNLNSTVKPQVSFIADSATNLTQNIYTNVLSRYNYAGFYEEQVCGLNDLEQMTVLDPTLTDDHMPDAVSSIPGNFVLSGLQVITNQTQIVQPFTQDPIPQFHNLLPALDGNYAIQALLVQWTPTNLVVPFPPVTAANIQTLPFAKAFIAIRTNYVERYQEGIDLFQATGDRIVLGTNGPALSSVDAFEMHPLGGTWKDYLWLNWSNGINYEPYLGMQIRDGQSANSDRYDAAGSWNANNFGSWKSTTCSALEEQYETTPADNRSDADIQLADPVFYQNTFVQRTVQFNYQTLGWTETNAPVSSGPAPAFNGRLVVEDGIKQPPGLLPAGLVINGQLTYSHRVKWFSVTDPRITQFTVNRNPTTIPQGPDRVYDIRISHVGLNRL